MRGDTGSTSTGCGPRNAARSAAATQTSAPARPGSANPADRAGATDRAATHAANFPGA